jgi:hypothetical protein
MQPNLPNIHSSSTAGCLALWLTLASASALAQPAADIESLQAAAQRSDIQALSARQPSLYLG